MTVGFLLYLILRGDAHAREECVEILLLEETQLARGLIHGNGSPHHQLAEVGELETAILGSLLGA